MATEVLLTRHKDRMGRVLLRPADAEAEEKLLNMTVPQGKKIRAKITVGRSSARNRWFHACASMVAEGIADPAWDLERVKTYLKLRIGLVDSYLIDGKTVAVAKSVAFDRMEEDVFAKFCDRSVEVIVTELIPGMDRADLVREVESMLGGGRRNETEREVANG